MTDKKQIRKNQFNFLNKIISNQNNITIETHRFSPINQQEMIVDYNNFIQKFGQIIHFNKNLYCESQIAFRVSFDDKTFDIIRQKTNALTHYLIYEPIPNTPLSNSFSNKGDHIGELVDCNSNICELCFNLIESMHLNKNLSKLNKLFDKPTEKDSFQVNHLKRQIFKNNNLYAYSSEL